MTPINDKPIEHTTSRGVTFKCARADLQAPIEITGLHRQPIVDEVAQAAIEFAAWHRGNIFDQLNGFSGYKRLQFSLWRGEPPPPVREPEEGGCWRSQIFFD